MPKILKVAKSGGIVSTKKDIRPENSLKSPDNHSLNTFYAFRGTYLNPNYEASLHPLNVTTSRHRLRTCLHNDKSAVLTNGFVTNEPKWYTTFKRYQVCQFTGEYFEDDVQTDSLKSARSRKHKRIEAFNSTFQPMYRKKRCTLWFATITLANEIPPISNIMAALKKRLKRQGIIVFGYLWVFEVGTKNGKHHLHYHLLLATSRMTWKGKLPNVMKFEGITKKRWKIEAVKGKKRTKEGKLISAYSFYLNKYISKKSPRFIPTFGRVRQFGSTIAKKMLPS